MKSVLVLGSGMVAGPIIEYLLEQKHYVTVASIDKARGEALIGNDPNGKFVYWKAEDESALRELVKSHDLAVSLLPYKFHVMVAKICLDFKKHMVTTSYVKPEMQALNNEAKEKGILLLNEIGVDPGIDHMSAMRIIDKVHNNGGEIEEFYSITGALPAPEAINNPLGYKFSWSPKGVILASKNDATYLHKGKEVYVEPKKLFQDIFEYRFPDVGTMDVYPNRNSIDYIDIYGIPEVETIFRGTFRFKSWCETLDLIKRLNLISTDEEDYSGLTYADFVRKVTGIQDKDLVKGIAEKVGLTANSEALKSLEFLGLFEEEDMKKGKTSPFEITSDLMIKRMWMDPKDRDMVAMQHVFLVKWENGNKEVIKSRMLDFGDPDNHTSIARTVALPAAIAVELILQGKINLTGVYRPVVEEVYEPVMQKLEKMNLKMIEEFELPETENIKK